MQVENNIPFTVLLAVYNKEKPEYLDKALESIWDNQTLRPSEIIIVKDGELTESLNSIIASFIKRAPVKIIQNEKNLGLGRSLAKGVTAASFEIIARMDSDDVSFPDRFEKQLPLMIGNDVVSSWSMFFENTTDNIIAIKKRPEYHEDIVLLAKKRSPVSHASCFLRRSKILEAGNYRHYPYYEDYDLWVRMILTGAKFYNLQDFVYWVRGSKEQIGRRGGFQYLKTELKAHREFKQSGFINEFEFLRNCIVRIVIRITPVTLRQYIYLLLWKTQSK